MKSYGCLTQNLMNFILEKLFYLKIPYLMDLDLGTSRVYTENEGKNHLCLQATALLIHIENRAKNQLNT